MSDKKALAAARNRRWREKNKERINAQQRARYDPAKWRNDYLKRTFGITQSDYEEMLALQGSRCAICGRAPDEAKALHIDHCHDSGKIRALLCGSCNRMLGLAKDSPEILEGAARYLRRYSA